MIIHNLNPVIWDIPGPLEIRWYGVMYLLAFFVTYYYAKNAIKNKKLNMTIKELDNFLGLLIIAMILGARAFYFTFYNPQAFLTAPWHFFYIWEGGLSFHGGLTGIIIAAIWYAKRKKLKFLHLADIFVVPIALGNAFGRIGNFINAELYGKITNLPWGVIFPGVEGARHPTQLYEAFYDILIFGILFAFRNKLKKRGQILGLFMILYAVFRFLVEYLKDLPTYGPLTMGQWLNIPLLIAGVWLFTKFK